MKLIEKQIFCDFILTLQLNFSRRSGPDTGYYSDRNDARNGFRDERGYLSDHSSRYICKMKTQRALFNKRLFPEAWLPTSGKTASALATSVTTSLGVDTSTEVNFAEIPSYQGHNIYPCLFQINTSDPSSGTVLTFDKVKLLSLFYVTCCACFRSSNKRSPLLVTFPMF